MTTEIEQRLAALHDRLDKAAARPTGRRRIPGDGDGDGIAHEGRNKKPGGGGTAARREVNVGTEKWPYKVPQSAALPKPKGDATHFVPGLTAKDHDMHHGGKHYSATGKTGTRRDGQKVREWSSSNGGKESRAWTNDLGHIFMDD